MIILRKMFPYLYLVRVGQDQRTIESVWETSPGVFCTAAGLPAAPDLSAVQPFAAVNICPTHGPPRIEARGQDHHRQPFVIVGDGLPGEVVTAAYAVSMGLPIPRGKAHVKRIKLCSPSCPTTRTTGPRRGPTGSSRAAWTPRRGATGTHRGGSALLAARSSPCRWTGARVTWCRVCRPRRCSSCAPNPSPCGATHGVSHV